MSGVDRRPGPEVTVRPYRSTDREAVRRICCATGYLGDPVDWMWRDRRSFADLFSGYYTDREPESATVAVLDGHVVGYLLGCVDTRRAPSLELVLARHVVLRGVALRPGTAGVIWRAAGDVVVDAARGGLRSSRRHLDLDRYPAHLHVDLLPEARGTGVGTRLVRGWLDRLRGDGIPGCHLQTIAENTGAVAFFEAMGFRRHGAAIPAPGERTRDGGRTHLQRMVVELAERPRAG